MDRDYFWLSEAQFARLVRLLPTDTRGRPRVDDRREISGIVHVLRSGCRWEDPPRLYGPHKALYSRFVRWAAEGVWHDVFAALAATGGPPPEMLLGSTHVKAHRSAACAKGGRSRTPLANRAADGRPRFTP